MSTVQILRSAASYRVAFDGVGSEPTALVALKVAGVLRAFPGISEIRVTAQDGLVIFTSVPVDVLPEVLDRKADTLRAQWAAVGEPSADDFNERAAAWFRKMIEET